MRSTATIILAFTSLVPIASLAAQPAQTVAVGARVRITVPDTMRIDDQPAIDRPLVVVGKLVAISDSTLLVHNDATADDVTVRRARLQRLEVGTGSDRARTAMKGGAIGLGVGLILGLAAGGDCSERGFICFSREQTAFGGAFLGGGIGVVIGALAGGERWRDASLPAHVSVVPTGARSMVITSTLRF